VVAIIVNESRVVPGRREEFLDLVRESVPVYQSLGALHNLREIAVGGSLSGVFSNRLSFDTPAARAAFTEGLLSNPTPLGAAAQRGDPPYSLLSRYYLNSEGPRVAVPSPVFRTVVVRRVAGRTEEADAAIAEWQLIRDNLGITARAFTVQNSDTEHGLLHLNEGAQSYPELEENAARVRRYNEDKERPGPLPAAVSAGALEMVRSMVSRRFEL
jgi:hypothetical protein